MRKVVILIAVIAFLAAGGYAFVWYQVQHNVTQPKTTSQLAVKNTASEPACTQQDSSSLSIDSKDRDSLSTVVIDHITNVPAGTLYNIYFATYDGKTATGSSIYPAKYGQYNFTAVQTGKPQGPTDMSGNDLSGGWQITQFKPCKLVRA